MIGAHILEESNMRLGYFICFVTAIGFICSLTYNHGYFWHFEAGIRMLSIGDILTSYSLWVPGLCTLFFGYCLDLFLQQIEQEETAKIKRHKKLIKRLLGLPHIVLLVIFTGIIIAHFSAAMYFRPLILWLAVCYLWASLAGLLYVFKVFASRTNRFILSFFIYLPVVLSLMLTLGLDKATLDDRLNKPNANIVFIEEKKVVQQTILLRHLERGLLAKEPGNKNFQLYVWDDISSIEIINQHL